MYKIYKIIDNTNNDNVYIGITKQTLKKRLAQHKCKKNCMSRDIIKNGDYRIELIEETHDKTRERYWIENSNCVNQIIPGRTPKDYREDNKDKIREHYINNRDKKLQQVKEYSEKNKDIIKEYQQEYRQNNPDKIKEYHKIRNNWMASMGGRPERNNMSLLKIDPNLFF